MSTVGPPARVERILDALGGDREFSHDIIGDLAEEFAIRVAWDGPVAARRWYYAECFRVAPHLLRDWRRSLRARDVLALIATTNGPIAAAMITEAVLHLGVFGGARLLGISLWGV